jgi:flagellar hook-associated protein 3 FlgL
MSKELDSLNTQVASGRKFAKTSEDVSSAVRAYQIRQSLSKVDSYQNNISHANSYLTDSESALGQIEDSLSEAKDKILQGMNGTLSTSDRTIIAKELRTMQEQMLQTMNSQSSGISIFGGSNTDTNPFTVDSATQKLMYNGQILDNLNSPASDTTINALKNDKLYVDIGLGLSLDGAGNVDKNTVFEYSIPGIQFTGNGTTSMTLNGATENVSNNFYDLLGRIATEFESSSYSGDTMNSLYGQFQTVTEKPYQTTTEIGAKTNYLDFMTKRYDTQDTNLQERQTEVEGIDAAYTYISYQTQKVAYNAALQMGQGIVQKSVFDYMA